MTKKEIRKYIKSWVKDYKEITANTDPTHDLSIEGQAYFLFTEVLKFIK